MLLNGAFTPEMVFYHHYRHGPRGRLAHAVITAYWDEAGVEAAPHLLMRIAHHGAHSAPKEIFLLETIFDGLFLLTYNLMRERGLMGLGGSP